MLAENSSVAAAVVAVAVPCVDPLDFREITFFSDNFKKSMILLVLIGQNSNKSNI